jgi:hypothetical protein
MSQETKHDFVLIKGIEIDKKIAPLIKDLWDMEIGTSNSCENVGDYVWIEFISTEDAELFLDLVATISGEEQSLYNRIRRAWGKPENPWLYDAYPMDLGVEAELLDDGSIEETFTGEHNFHFLLSIRFPISDLPEVLQSVQTAAKELRRQRKNKAKKQKKK